MVASLAELSPLLPDAARPAAVEVLFAALPAIEDAGAPTVVQALLAAADPRAAPQILRRLRQHAR